MPILLAEKYYVEHIKVFTLLYNTFMIEQNRTPQVLDTKQKDSMFYILVNILN